MALKDKWVDRIDGVDIASANDINQVAQAVIELEETGGGNGADGKSAYDIAVKNGFEGTEAEWLESLKGEDGAAGTRFIAQAEKPSETDVLWLDTDDDSESGGGTAQPMEKLTFTGAVEAEYDGSEPVTVEIPQGGGGGGGTWEDICHITLEEAVNQVTYDIPDGCTEVFVIIRGLLATTNSGSIVAMDFTDTFKLAQSGNWLFTNNIRGAMAHFKLMAGNITGVYTGSNVQFADTAGWNAGANLVRNQKTLKENRFGTFNLWHSNGTFASGFTIDIWGLKQ